MKITFTGITKEEAIRKLDASAARNRAFAARTASMGEMFATVAAQDMRKAEKCDTLSAMVKASTNNEIYIDDSYEGTLFFALAADVDSMYAAYSLYTITPETVAEMPFEAMLAMGEQEAAKTE